MKDLISTILDVDMGVGRNFGREPLHNDEISLGKMSDNLQRLDAYRNDMARPYLLEIDVLNREHQELSAIYQSDPHTFSRRHTEWQKKLFDLKLRQEPYRNLEKFFWAAARYEFSVDTDSYIREGSILAIKKSDSNLLADQKKKQVDLITEILRVDLLNSPQVERAPLLEQDNVLGEMSENLRKIEVFQDNLTDQLLEVTRESIIELFDSARAFRRKKVDIKFVEELHNNWNKIQMRCHNLREKVDAVHGFFNLALDFEFLNTSSSKKHKSIREGNIVVANTDGGEGLAALSEIMGLERLPFTLMQRRGLS